MSDKPWPRRGSIQDHRERVKAYHYKQEGYKYAQLATPGFAQAEWDNGLCLYVEEQKIPSRSFEPHDEIAFWQVVLWLEREKYEHPRPGESREHYIKRLKWLICQLYYTPENYDG